MPEIFYAHRLQRALQEMVVNAGLTLYLSDENTEFSLEQYSQTIKAMAEQMRLQVTFEETENGVLVTFRKG